MSTCRHIGVVDEHQLNLAQIFSLNLLEIGVESIGSIEFVLQHLAARQCDGSTICGVAGVGNQYLVAFVEERHTDVHNALLGAEQRKNLTLGVQFYVIPLLVPISISLTK